MHVARRKTVCTAKNAFKPSIVIWQQFVAANPPIPLQRASSTVAANGSGQPLRLPTSNQASKQPTEPLPSDHVSEHRPAESAQKPKIYYPRPESIAAANARQVDDINPHDLSATLEAHRASNRASIIRPSMSDQNGTDFKQTNVVSKIRFTNTSSSSERLDLDRGAVLGDKPQKHKGKGEKIAKADNFAKVKNVAKDETSDQDPAMDPMLKLEGSKANLKGLNRRTLTKRTFKQATELLEYTGQNVLPLSDGIIDENELPWVVKEDRKYMTGSKRLSEEIARFYSYVVPTTNEQNARRAVIAELRNIVKELYPKHKLDVFGSEWNGTALAISDIDFRLSLPALEGTTRGKAPRYIIRKRLSKDLLQIHKKMQQSGIYMLCQMRWARYPLISVQHVKSRLDLQVVAANDTSLSRAHMQKYMKEHPGLKEIFSLIKVLFDTRGLSDVFRGGLGSYSLFLMTVASMKLGPQEQHTSLGQQLLSFLKFWSKFDTYSTGISLEPAELFAKSSRVIITQKQKKNLDQLGRGRLTLSQVDPSQPYLLCLQDPADAANDVGKKGFAIKHIQATFAHLEKELKLAVEQNSRPSLLAPLVGFTYALNKERRAIMEEFGASVEIPEEAAVAVEEAPREEITLEQFKKEYTKTDDTASDEAADAAQKESSEISENEDGIIDEVAILAEEASPGVQKEETINE